MACGTFGAALSTTRSLEALLEIAAALCRKQPRQIQRIERPPRRRISGTSPSTMRLAAVLRQWGLQTPAYRPQWICSCAPTHKELRDPRLNIPARVRPAGRYGPGRACSFRLLCIASSGLAYLHRFAAFIIHIVPGHVAPARCRRRPWKSVEMKSLRISIRAILAALEEENRLALLLAEDSNQNIAPLTSPFQALPHETRAL